MKWKGPYEDGLTQSMISYWLKGCPHRFFIKYCLGLKEKEPFDHKLEFGNLMHDLIEQYHLGNKNTDKFINGWTQGRAAQYPVDTEKIIQTGEIAKRTLPLYLKSNPKDRIRVKSREQVFSVWYGFKQVHSHTDKQKSTRDAKVRLRGKYDGLYYANKKEHIQELKCKGFFEIQDIEDTIKGNIQTMMYLLSRKLEGGKPVGVCYDVIRRPLADQRAPKQRKTETYDEYLERCFVDYVSTQRGYSGPYPINENLNKWIYRRIVPVTAGDLKKWERTTFISILNQICNWWDSIQHSVDPFDSPLHYIKPFGIFDSDFNVRGNYYDYIVNGTNAGLVCYELFSELQ